MIKSMEIYYADLNEKAKKKFDTLFGSPEEHNHEICPLCFYEQEESED